MLEKHRLTYLDALGIDNYMPRCVLPHAMPSQLLPDEALAEPTAFSTADAPVVESITSTTENSLERSLDRPLENPLESSLVRATSPSALDELLGNTPAAAKALDVNDEGTSQSHPEGNKQSEAAVSAKEAANNPSSGASTDIRFALNTWRVSNDILVLDSRQPGAALPTDRLLQNILRSMDCHLAQLPQSEILRWPLFKDDYDSHPEEEARAMVQAYISAQSSKAPFKTLLLFGKDAVRFSLTMEQPIDVFFDNHQGTALEQSQWQSQALICPSLIDMLQEPMQKKVTWQALQSVISHS